MKSGSLGTIWLRSWCCCTVIWLQLFFFAWYDLLVVSIHPISFLGIPSTSTLSSAQRETCQIPLNFKLQLKATNAKVVGGLMEPTQKWPYRVFIREYHQVIPVYPRKYPPCHWWQDPDLMAMAPLILCLQVSYLIISRNHLVRTYLFNYLKWFFETLAVVGTSNIYSVLVLYVDQIFC